MNNRAQTNTAIPGQHKGKANDLGHTTTFERHEEAVNCFRQATRRMLHPQQWHELAGLSGTTFRLVDGKGASLTRSATSGDFICIDLPGPGTATGDGYDWVRVDVVDYRHHGKEEEYTMTLKPCASPLDDSGATAHFFDEDASSTFIIRRIDNLVSVSYHGRNEVPNIHTGKVADNVRNAAVAVAALAGLSEVQWSQLTDAFLG